jgi:acyl-CoA dehydrogenase
VDIKVPDVAADAHEAATAIIAGAGGVDIARECEADPPRRAQAGALLEAFGIDDLDPREGIDSAMVAAALCRAAGAAAFPFPVTGRLLGDSDHMVALAPESGAVRINHGDLGVWEVIDLQGHRHTVVGGTAIAQPLAPFLTDAVPDAELPDLPASDAALWLVLESWLIFGGIERALGLVTEYLPERRQFGKPLSSFQGLRFRVADLVVLLRGVEELAKFTVWSHFEVPEDALVDALALRIACQEASRRIFQDAHLLHGAIGFCDEHDLSFLNRHLQPNVRLPWDFEATSSLMLDQVESRGINTLYGRFGVPVEASSQERT